MAECPLALERLLVALDLAVGLRPTRRDQEVVDGVSLEQLAERAVVTVDEGVVREQPLGLDPVGGEDGETAGDERGHRRRALVPVELAVGEP